jgi:hypothetical protein
MGGEGDGTLKVERLLMVINGLKTAQQFIPSRTGVSHVLQLQAKFLQRAWELLEKEVQCYL